MKITTLNKIIESFKNNNKLALIENDKYIKYSEIYSEISILKNIVKLYNSRVISLLLPNSLEFVLAMFCVVNANRVVLPIGCHNTANEVIAFLKQSGSKIIITNSGYSNLMNMVKNEIEDLEIVLIDKYINKYAEKHDDLNDYYNNKIKLKSGNITYNISKKNTNINNSKTALKNNDISEKIVNKNHKKHFNKANNLNINNKNILNKTSQNKKYLNSKKTKIGLTKHVSFMIPTSGTTGEVKLVMLSQKNIITSLNGFINKINFKRDKPKQNKFYINTPYYTSYGIMVLLTCFKLKIPFVVNNQKFDINDIFSLIEKHKITHYEGATIISNYLNNTSPNQITHNIDSLEYVAFGGNKVHKNVMENLYLNYNKISFFQGYGMTETSPLITKPFSHGKQKKLYINKKLESVGTKINKIKIFTFDGNMLTKKANAVGELVVKGNNVMLGYYNNKIETDKILKNNFLYTGDIGYKDKDGYIFIIGRSKNIVNLRGLNVYPEEVEGVINTYKDIEDCVVYAKNIMQSNEKLCVDIVLKTEEFDLKKFKGFLDEKLSSYKIPSEINVVNEIIKGDTGKKIRR